ncbi:hypothetical protein HU200_021272 [Digitaria exilis]|uniref:Uncharacterized protein n=1 Tax=Digitaria exilis TaxID=1010633 RepID=A0A835F096_9POAL|nr:hypothetical protein HU200_021272 [Digitaria exilis]
MGLAWDGMARRHTTSRPLLAAATYVRVKWPLLGAVRAHGLGIHLSAQGVPMPR